MGSRIKKVLKTLLKISISGLALYFVFSKIKWSDVSELLFSSNVLLLLLALVFFVLSKILSAYRLLGFFRCIPIDISKMYNLRLYWIGMFYNLFLPGGIGGDGYKVYLLNKTYGVGPKKLIQASLVDRISGLLSLLILAGFGVLFLGSEAIPQWLIYVDFVCLVLAFPVFYLLVKLLFKPFLPFTGASVVWSLGVQGLQVIGALFVLFSIGVHEQYVEYGVLFLASSFVSILPFTIGGIGSREFTFLLGYQYLGTGENTSIALSLLITFITAIMSFGGVFLKTAEVNETHEESIK
ncbi:MAG: lysylphosphatidylglycerol synthase transmembrane domain-containing protein [Cyclobacteriaceae bacterium]